MGEKDERRPQALLLFRVFYWVIFLRVAWLGAGEKNLFVSTAGSSFRPGHMGRLPAPKTKLNPVQRPALRTSQQLFWTESAVPVARHDL